MDVNEFIERARKKINMLGLELLPKIPNGHCWCAGDSMYELSQAIEVFQDPLTDEDCVERSISVLSEKYCLEDLTLNEGSGISIFRIDDNDDCSVFRIYA